jgi:hypothetical protein
MTRSGHMRSSSFMTPQTLGLLVLFAVILILPL